MGFIVQRLQLPRAAVRGRVMAAGRQWASGSVRNASDAPAATPVHSAGCTAADGAGIAKSAASEHKAPAARQCLHPGGIPPLFARMARELFGAWRTLRDLRRPYIVGHACFYARAHVQLMCMRVSVCTHMRT